MRANTDHKLYEADKISSTHKHTPKCKMEGNSRVRGTEYAFVTAELLCDSNYVARRLASSTSGRRVRGKLVYIWAKADLGIGST